MTEEDPPEEPWHERNAPKDAEVAAMYAYALYTDGEPRGRGIFTHVDREYIVGVRESDTPQQRSNVRGKQVQRISDALDDFELLNHLDDRTKDRIFQDAAVPFVHQTLRNIVRFFYEGVDRDKEIVEDAVESAVWEAESAGADGEVKSVDAEVTIEQAPDPHTALEMFKNEEYDRLTLEQIGVLAREGLLEGDDWKKLEWPVFGANGLDYPGERDFDVDLEY